MSPNMKIPYTTNQIHVLSTCTNRREVFLIINFAPATVFELNFQDIGQEASCLEKTLEKSGLKPTASNCLSRREALRFIDLAKSPNHSMMLLGLCLDNIFPNTIGQPFSSLLSKFLPPVTVLVIRAKVSLSKCPGPVSMALVDLKQT